MDPFRQRAAQSPWANSPNRWGSAGTGYKSPYAGQAPRAPVEGFGNPQQQQPMPQQQGYPPQWQQQGYPQWQQGGMGQSNQQGLMAGLMRALMSQNRAPQIQSRWPWGF